MTDEIRISGDLQRLSLKPGDKLVFSTEQHLYPEQIERFRAELERIAPGHEVIFLSGGSKLEILQAAD